MNNRIYRVEVTFTYTTGKTDHYTRYFEDITETLQYIKYITEYCYLYRDLIPQHKILLHSTNI